MSATRTPVVHEMRLNGTKMQLFRHNCGTTHSLRRQIGRSLKIIANPPAAAVALLVLLDRGWHSV